MSVLSAPAAGLVEGVVRQRTGSLEVVAVRPSGPLEPMSRALVERSARAAQLTAGLWRLAVTKAETADGDVQASVMRIGDEGAAVAVVRVAREAKEAVVVRELFFSRGDAEPSLEERLSSLVSEGVAAAGSDVPEEGDRWLELVFPSAS